MPIGHVIGVWIAAILTFMIFSFLYKDNPVFKLGEHIFLGFAVGYSWCIYYWNDIFPQAIQPLAYPTAAAAASWHRYLVLIPIILGIFIIVRIVPSLPGWAAGITQFVLLLGVFCTIVFFFFSLEHTGVVGRVGRVGVLFIMVAFGASFGYTVMARISLLIGRFQFLINDWVKGVIFH